MKPLVRTLRTAGRSGVVTVHRASIARRICPGTVVLGRGWTDRQLANWTERVVLDDLFGLEPVQHP